MNDDQFLELMYQALQTEQGGTAVYETAVEEQKHVTTAIGASRAEQARDDMK